METKLAIAHVIESRADFLALRRSLVAEQIAKQAWIKTEFRVLESDGMNSLALIDAFVAQTSSFAPDGLIVHLPIWADPIFTVRLAGMIRQPVLLLGNDRPDTSSMVGLLGAGGALDQIGREHLRVFDGDPAVVRAFARAAGALRSLRGQTLGLFGGRSLGIFTAEADAAQWQRLFGVDIQYIDQLEIQKYAEALPHDQVAQQTEWLLSRVHSLRYGGLFNAAAFERQMRSYLATRDLAEQYGFQFVGVKCQPEMSDGYVTQCVAHLLMNGFEDGGGPKAIKVHACESDADGALTMQILHLLTGRPAALLDVRWLDPETGLWVLANCGAVPAALCALEDDPGGLSQVRIEPHTFGRGGGGALPAVLAPGKVTLARLCRKNGQYWMALLAAEVEPADAQRLGMVTPAFPKGLLRTSAGMDFLNEFGSNHIHMVSGNILRELKIFCRLAGIPCRSWE